jgi:cadmium resistance protein CadD (predicted permease)
MTAGIVAATALITATTLDDAVWLVPYCAGSHLPFSTKAIHALTFVGTLELLAGLCVLFAKVFHDAVDVTGKRDEIDEQFILGAAGAIICWVLAIGLYVKKLRKRRRKKAAALALSEKNSLQLQVDDKIGEMQPLLNGTSVTDTEMAVKSDDSAENVELGESASASNLSTSDGSERDIPTTPSVWMVISLTTLGALDEISYFPTLLLGNVFSPYELLLGTLLASVLILMIVVLYLRKLKPLVDFLDSIPLYGIVGMFAVILTIGLVIPL